MLPCLSILAFWSFASGWMLLWALAASLPLLLHWWNRRHYRQTNWAAMQFLLAAMQKNARRIAFEQWLLLALRITVLLLFALALAEPIFSRVAPRSPLASEGQTFTLLVVDASLSMDYRDAARSRFDKARDLARKLVLQGGQGEAFALLLLADPPQPIILRPAFDPGDVLEELAAIQVSPGRGDLPATLAQAVEMVERVAQRQPQFTSRRVVFLTDVELTTWDSAASATCREQFARLSRLGTSTLVNLGGGETSNIAVTGLEASQPLILPGQAVEFEMELQSFGNRSAGRAQLELLVDGNRQRDEAIELPVGAPVSVRISHTFDAAGDHLVEARVNDPHLLLDNSRWLAVSVRDALRVLCLEGRPHEARRLALAFNPEPAQRPHIMVTVAADSTLLNQDLTEFDAVCLCNVARFSTDEVELLANFVERGGGLVIFPGDQVQAENYNSTLGAPSTAGAPALLPARLGEPIAGAQYAFDPLEYRHPILAPFRGHERSGLLTTPVWKYLQLQPQNGSQTVLGFAGGDPALVAGKLGSGRTLLFASAVSPQSMDRSRNPPLPWAALDMWPSFPPLAQQMLEYVVSADAGRRNVLVGAEFRGNLKNEAGATSVTVIAPSGDRTQAPVSGENGDWSSRADAGAGPYQVVAPASDVRALFVANVDTSESSLATLDPEQLPRELRLDLRDDPAATGLEPPRPWFRVLLFAVFGLLLVESFVAWRMGR